MQTLPMVTLKPWLWRLIFFAVAALLCVFLYRHDTARSLLSDGTNKHFDCALSWSLTRSLDLTTPVSYAKLRIDVADPNAGHASNTSHNAGKKLGIDLPETHVLQRKWNFNLVAEDGGSCTTATTIEIPRPPSTPANAANLVFGVATPLKRLEDSLQAFSHWAANTGTTIYALVNHENIADRDIARVTRKAADLGITLDIARQNLSGAAGVGDHYFAMIKHVYERVSDPEHVRPEQAPEFAGFIDDDTFFPSMRALLDRLAAYDPSQPHYIGGLSEDVVLLDLIGYMAYGGAGVFLSLPMLAQVYENWDDCNKWHDRPGGDIRLKKCIYGHTTSELEVEERLHQVDLHKDVSGFYEAGRALPLSIHHWKSWNHVDIVAMAAVAKICGDEQLLRRYQFRDGWYLANGFSIFRYSDWADQDGPPEDAMEETWELGGDYVDRLGPLRPKDPDKKTYRLVRSVTEEKRVRQFYVDRRDTGDGVIEVEWRRV